MEQAQSTGIVDPETTEDTELDTLDDFLAGGPDQILEAVFDRDLIADPYHPKRFRHLHNVAVGEWAANDWGPPLSPNRRLLYGTCLVAGIGVLLACWYLSDWLSYPNQPLEPTLTIHLTQPAVTPKTPAPETPEPSLKSPSPAPIESPEPSESSDKPDTAEPDNESPSATPSGPSSQQGPSIRSQITTVVEGLDPPPSSPVESRESLRDELEVFDPHLAKALRSERMERLNQSRLPTDIVVNVPGHGDLFGRERSFFMIGRDCYQSSPPLMDGYSPAVNKIDCDLLYMEESLTRENIQPR